MDWCHERVKWLGPELKIKTLEDIDPYKFPIFTTQKMHFFLNPVHLLIHLETEEKALQVTLVEVLQTRRITFKRCWSGLRLEFIFTLVSVLDIQ